MQNETESLGEAQSASTTVDPAPTADGDPVSPGPGDDVFTLTSEERALIAKQAKEGDVVEIRGHRLLIISDIHGPRLSAAHLAALLEFGPLVQVNDPFQDCLGSVGKPIRPTIPDIKIDIDGDGHEERKGNRRKPWESPFGNPSGKRAAFQPPRNNNKRMSSRRGGR
jgi:hypothetical protein